MFWVTQTELTNTMFQLLTPEMVGLLEKVKELSVVNATIAKKQRATLRKLFNLTLDQVERLLKS